MKTIALSFTKTTSRYAILILVCLILPACNPQADTLSEREARIKARESELVTLFAELVELKKSLEKDQTDQRSARAEDANTPAADICACETTGSGTSAQGSATKVDSKTVLGAIENVHLDPPGLEFSARIDTGAQTSSLNALDITEFERDGKPFVKFNLIHPQSGEKIELTRRLRGHVRVKELGGREALRRPIVRMRVVLADIDEQINFTLENRSRFQHQVLIGRNLLQDLAVVDVSKKPAPAKNDSPAAAVVK
ncbi:MAG: ATP-dependent zinc protease [Betaproteobacteria bacterium]|nr:ATP-dependent zinc protease [Betaproteobacteria bacterium]